MGGSRMDQEKTGRLIRLLRQRKSLTQLELAEKIGVSDKAVSKWERGLGAPDISLLPLLGRVLGVNVAVLLKGNLEENEKSSGNMKKLQYYVCPDCGNLLFSTDEADVNCCGKKLTPLKPQKPDAENAVQIEASDGEWYLTSCHEMQRDHYFSFVAFLSGDTLVFKKQYPEWGLETRLPFFRHGTFLWYCTRHGLFAQAV